MSDELKDLVNYGLKCCNAITDIQYADVRYMETLVEALTYKNDTLEQMSITKNKGIGIRCLINNAWGFAATNELKRETITETVKKAAKIARASALARKFPIELTEEKVFEDTVKTKIKKDPFNVDLIEKIEILKASVEEARNASDRVKIAIGSYTARKDRMVLYTTEGTKIDQTIIWCGGGISATAIESGMVQIRSLPASFRGDFKTRGFEHILELSLPEEGARAGKEAAALLHARKMPSEKTTIILGHSQLALQVHESCGHPTELDRALGYEAAYAGTSFLTPDLLEKEFKYGNELVTMTADATLEGGLGSFFYDSEGVKAQRTLLIDKGILVGFMSSRETAKAIGLEHSSGAARAMSYNRIPIIRMTNVNLEPGDWELEELIQETKYGYFLDTNRSWSIDDLRLNFQFGTEIGWKIEKGELTELIKNPTYTGITPEFWNSVSGICKKKYWKIFGTPNCGKGEPSQVAYVGHGVAPTRFENVRVGVISSL